MKPEIASFNSFNTVGSEELMNIARIIEENKPLSGYIGSHPMGGEWVTRLEARWSEIFEVKHAVAVNSATSGLLAACMAIELRPDDEVIVSPYTMSATAAAPKVLGAKLVWADIEKETFNIDPVEVAEAITNKTKAVIVTNLFGHPASLHELRDICDQKGVYLIEDNAQSIFAKEQDRYAGTIGHIGVFSLNVHKHLQTGEGGICVTNGALLSENLRAAMNHGEMRGHQAGLNLRMTEITAAMACAQLDKYPAIMKGRIEFAEYLSECLERYSGIVTPVVRADCTHSYYVWAAQIKSQNPIPAPFKRGYMRPLYTLPAFITRDFHYPVVEQVEKDMVLLEICSISPTKEQIEDMANDLVAAL